MRKYFTELKRIIVVFLVVVNCCCFVCGCDWGWDWRGPYHHAAIVSTPKKTVAVGEDVYSLIDKKLYKHNNGRLEFIDLYYYPAGNRPAVDLASDNEKLYLACNNKIFSLENDGLSLVHSTTTVYSLEINNGKIYYVGHKEYVDREKKYALYSYEIESQTQEVICEFLGVQGSFEKVRPQLITVDNRLLFINEQMHLSWVDSIDEQNRASICLRPYIDDLKMYEEISFVLEEDIAYLKTIEQGVEFQYLDKVYEYPIQTNNLRLYPIVKVIDNKVYFAVNDWSQKEDCERTDCVCRYNASMLIVFDLANEQFSLQKQIGEKDVFIDFSKDECIYYSKDSVYKNDSIIKMVGEIQPGVFYKIVEGVPRPRPVYELKLAYFGGNLNYVLYENIDSLSTEYA